MEQSGGEQEPGAVRYRALRGADRGKKDLGEGICTGVGRRIRSSEPGRRSIYEADSKVTAARKLPPTPLYPQASGPSLGRRATPLRPEPGTAAPATSAAASQPGLPGTSAAAPCGVAPL